MNKDKDTNDAISKVEASDAGKLAKDAVKSGSEYYREGSRAIASTVQEQPLSSLLVAGVIGFMLALVLNSNGRDEKLREMEFATRRGT